MTTGGLSSKGLARVRDLLERHVDAGFAHTERQAAAGHRPAAPACRQKRGRLRMYSPKIPEHFIQVSWNEVKASLTHRTEIIDLHGLGLASG